MFTHDDIWAAIDRLAEAKGMSASGLARQAGLDPTAFNRSKRISPNGKPRWPSTESIAKILEVTDSTMSDLFDLMGGEAAIARNVPVLTYAAVRAGRITPVRGHDVLDIAFDIGDSAFAMTLDDERMHPILRKGAMLVADPEARLRTDDRALVYVRQRGLKGGIVGGLQKRVLTLLQPEHDFTAEDFAEGDIEWTARIMWSSH